MSESTSLVLSRYGALSLVRNARKVTFFISVGQHAPIAGETKKYFPVMGNVIVSRKVALKFIADTYSETLAARGAMCEIRQLSDCLFIGCPA